MALCGTAANLSAWILAETPRRANPFVQALGEDRRPVEAVLNVFLRCKSAVGDGRPHPSVRLGKRPVSKRAPDICGLQVSGRE
jgi:hypothetical protein